MKPKICTNFSNLF